MTIVGGVPLLGLGLFGLMVTGLAISVWPELVILGSFAWIVLALFAATGTALIVLAILAMRGRFWAVVVLAVIGAVCTAAIIVLEVTSDSSSIVTIVLDTAYIVIAVALMVTPSSLAWLRSRSGR